VKQNRCSPSQVQKIWESQSKRKRKKQSKE